MKSSPGFRNTDALILFNAALFLFMTWYAYYDRFVMMRGAANIAEFYLYAVLILAGLVVLRFLLRWMNIPNHVLVLAQIGVVLHFIGGLWVVEGVRVYDLDWHGVHYDKAVHFYNAFAGALALDRFRWSFEGVSRFGRWLILFTSILGFGAIIEIIEYLASLTVRGAGVGDYGNNLCDMIANAGGTLFYILFAELSARRVRSADSAGAGAGMETDG